MQSSAGTTDGSHLARTVNDSRTVSGPDTTDEWPVVPPVPTPTPPPPPLPAPEPPFIHRGAQLAPPVSPAVVGPDVARPPAAPVPARQFAQLASRTIRQVRVPAVSGSAMTVALRTRPLRRPIVVPSRSENQVWQPRFAYSTAAVVLGGFVVVALPVWLALYRTVGTPGTQLAHVLPLAMMLLGGLLTAVTAWVVIVEMRARIRMVDALGRTGEHEAPGAPGISAFAGLLRPVVAIPAQVALLAVALCLFIGATVLAV